MPLLSPASGKEISIEDFKRLYPDLDPFDYNFPIDTNSIPYSPYDFMEGGVRGNTQNMSLGNAETKNTPEFDELLTNVKNTGIRAFNKLQKGVNFIRDASSDLGDKFKVANNVYKTGYDKGTKDGYDKGVNSATLSDVLNRYWNDYCTAMGEGDWKAWGGTIGGAMLVGYGLYKAAQKWKEYRRKRAQQDGISLSPELEK